MENNDIPRITLGERAESTVNLYRPASLEQKPPIKNLATKMLAIMDEVSHVKKGGYNDFHKFKYVKESDVMEAVSAALVKHRVFMFSKVLERHCETYQTRGGKAEFLVTVKLEITFVDADSGEQFSSTFYGDGSDGGDKGLYKALAGGYKYCLLKSFLISSGDDPERDAGQPKQQQAATAPVSIDVGVLTQALENHAKLGTKAFRDFWVTLTSKEKQAMGPHVQRFKQICDDIDQAKSAADDGLAF